MASEWKEFIAALEPVWEDSNEFNWLKDKQTKEIKLNAFEYNRFPGLKMLLEIK